jgi:hypothetical protein
LLDHNYTQAVSLLRAAKTDPAYVFEVNDEMNLADAYFKAGQLDPALYFVEHLPAAERKRIILKLSCVYMKY